MSLIVSEVYDALIEAGTSKEKAKAAASAIPLAEHLATRQDLADQFAKLDEKVTGLDKKFAALDKKVAVLNLAVFSFGPAMLALLAKLVFFP